MALFRLFRKIAFVLVLESCLSFQAFAADNFDDETDNDCANVLVFVHPKKIRDATLDLWADNPDPIRGAARFPAVTLLKIVEDLNFVGSLGHDDQRQFEILWRIVDHPNVNEKVLVSVLSYLDSREHFPRFELGYSGESVALASRIARHPTMGERLLAELVKTMYRTPNGTPFAEALLSDEVINHPQLRPEQFILLTDHVLVPTSFKNESHFLELLLDRALTLPAKDAQALLMRIEDFGKRVLLNKSLTFTERERFIFASKLLDKAPLSQDLAHQMILIERKWFENIGKQGLRGRELVLFSKRLHAAIVKINNEKLSALSLSIVAKYEKLEMP